jgi:methylmalonyl-CoA mutase N-terminal domain/subunit
LGLPTEASATIALRTQQILAEETGVPDTADPLAGSYYVESLTSQLIDLAKEWLERVDDEGGAVAAIEHGFVQNAIADNAYARERRIDSGEDVIIGVNRFADDREPEIPIQPIDEQAVAAQIQRLCAYRAAQEPDTVSACLKTVRETARGDGNLLVDMKAALLAGATLGQICTVLREEFGQHVAY